MADNLGFVLSQVAHIERQVFKRKYPTVRYPSLVPVDTGAWSWAPTITHFSTDFTGKAQPVAARGDDFPVVKREHFKHDVTIEMDGIGYEFSMEEIEQARRLSIPLESENAMACRFLAERRIDEYAMEGNAKYGWDSLLKSTKVTATTAPANGASSSTKWEAKTAIQILNEINDLLLSVYTSTNTVEMANTLLLPPNIWATLAGKFIDGTATSLLNAVRENNVFTMKTGMPLMIEECRGLENAAAGNEGRALAYYRDRSVLRLHLPMPFRFMRTEYHLMKYMTPGIFRCGGLEIRLPGAMRYLDGITT